MEDSGRSVIFLSEEHICDINADFIASFGGWQVGYPNLRQGFHLQYLLASVRYPVFGVDPYPTLIDKAAAIAWYIITRHPFHDTNKRTGLQAAIEFLELNGFSTFFDPSDVVATVLKASGGGMTYEEFREWIAANVRCGTAS